MDAGIEVASKNLSLKVNYSMFESNRVIIFGLIFIVVLVITH